MTSKVSQGLFRLDVKDTFRRVVDELTAIRYDLHTGSATYNGSSLADAAGETTTINVPGAELGDFALMAHGVSLAGLSATPYVSTPGVVSVRFQNETAATADLASATLRAMVIPRRNIMAVLGADALFGQATYDHAGVADAAGATTTVTVTGAALGDFAFASLGVSAAGGLLTPYVSSANTVSLQVQNETGASLDLASTALTAAVLPYGSVAKAFNGELLTGATTFDGAELLDGVGETTTVTVTGAQLGDYVFCSLGVDAAGLIITPYVSAANTVSVRFQNESAATVNLASTTLRVCVMPRAKVTELTARYLTK